MSVGELEGKRPLGRHTRTWKDDIKIHLHKKCGIQVAQDSVV
jgi:hypothetical protein